MSDSSGFDFVMRRRIVPAGDGTFRLDFTEEERSLLRTLPHQLRELLRGDDRADPAMQRLFPPAYREDEEREQEYQELMRGELLDHRLEALEVLDETVDATTITEEQLMAWMGAVNDLRLVLGVRLDVTEDIYEAGLPANDPRAAAFDLFTYLGVLMEQFVEAAAGT